MTRMKATVAAAALLSTGLMAVQAAAAVDPGRAAVVQALSDCRKQTDDAARLACYDKAADAFEQAQNKGDVVVVDREQVRQVTRQSFGFNLPSFSIFSRGTKEAPPENIEVHIASAQQEPGGKWVLVTDENSVWEQIDTTPLNDTPRQGEKLVIRRAMLGSYFCKLGNEAPLRCTRQR
jgi:hypothetical protein